VDLEHPRALPAALSRIGHFIARPLETPYSVAEPFIEAHALVGLDMWTF
jgi:hypothetical protein